MARVLAGLALLGALATPHGDGWAAQPVEDSVPVRRVELGAGDPVGLHIFGHLRRPRALLRGPRPVAGAAESPHEPFDPESWLRERRAAGGRSHN